MLDEKCQMLNVDMLVFRSANLRKESTEAKKTIMGFMQKFKSRSSNLKFFGVVIVVAGY